MAEFTKGPWKVEHDGPSLPIITAIVDGRWDFVATVEHAGGADEANARLIAAAPDLLEALQEYMSAFGQALEANDITFNLQQQDADAMARAALAKARGEQP